MLSQQRRPPQMKRRRHVFPSAAARGCTGFRCGSDVRLVRKIDRRSVSARTALVARVSSEFQIPGLRIRSLHASRLFDLHEDICLRILDCLVVEGVLGRTSEGLYYGNRAMPSFVRNRAEL